MTWSHSIPLTRRGSRQPVASILAMSVAASHARRCAGLSMPVATPTGSVPLYQCTTPQRSIWYFYHFLFFQIKNEL
ncbi:MAG: hypothetical protein QOD88_3758 [Mycobacterium sp.]|jgi:hypothetical protein|nr:hypothetical protein [Mycobacterium sp.]